MVPSALALAVQWRRRRQQRQATLLAPPVKKGIPSPSDNRASTAVVACGGVVVRCVVRWCRGSAVRRFGGVIGWSSGGRGVRRVGRWMGRSGEVAESWDGAWSDDEARGVAVGWQGWQGWAWCGGEAVTASSGPHPPAESGPAAPVSWCPPHRRGPCSPAHRGCEGCSPPGPCPSLFHIPAPFSHLHSSPPLRGASALTW